MNGKTPEWAALQLKLRHQIKQTMAKYREAYGTPFFEAAQDEAHGGELMDSCTILLPYIGFARWTGDREIRDWLYEWRDAYADVMRNDRGLFRHGFPVVGEAHHQWEDQSRFLSRLWFLDRNDPVNAYVVDDAAEHVGNWVEGIPDWYDWERHDFRSYWFGTEKVAHLPGFEGIIWGDASVTPPTGIYREALYRVTGVVLNAWFATGKERYLDWTRDMMDAYVRRLETMGAEEDLVKIFAREGWPLPVHRDYFTRNGWPHPVNKFVYGRYVPALLTDLYSITGEAKYAEAARTFLDFCIPGVLEYWHQRYFYGLLLRYRLVTGDTRHDTAVMEAIETACAQEGDFDPARYPFDWNGVRVLGYSCNRGPMAHMAQYWITGDEKYAVKALDQACRMADVLLERDSKEYVESFATPHIGGIVDDKLVNTLLNLAGWRPGMMAHHVDVMDIRLFDEEGGEGIPENVAILRRPAPLDRCFFALHNAGDAPVRLNYAAGGITEGRLERILVREEDARYARITLQPNSTVEIQMRVARS